MNRLRRLANRRTNAPLAIVIAVTVLLLAGIGIIVQNEAAYRTLQQQETRMQAEILAASASAAVDFADRTAAQEAVDALQVNRGIRTVGLYDNEGQLLASYGREGDAPPAQSGGLSTVNVSGIVSTVPVTSGGERIGSVFLVADPEPLGRRLARYLLVALFVVMAALVIIVLGTTQNALRRINQQLKERASALAQANAELKVQITQRTLAEEELRQAQKLQALGQLTGGIAHDFNNLLTVIQGSSDMLRRPGLEEGKRIRFAEAIVQASARAAALTGQLLAFARRQPLQPEIIDVNALIGGMIDLLDRTLGERIKVETSLAREACAVEADRAQLESAILNVAVNARDAMPDGGILTLSTEKEDGEKGAPLIGVTVSDTGTGMDKDTLARAIEPFFTTKATGKGTGLGLSQVYGFATQSGGDVRITSAPNQGTSVTLLLPCSGRAASHRAEERALIMPVRTGHVLLVEDNEEVGAFATTLLEEIGFRVRWAHSGEEALEKLDAAPVDAVFSDVVMPGMSGLELGRRIRAVRPDLPIILTTGYSDQIAAAGSGGFPVILKPYRLETLTEVLNQALSGRPG